MADLGSSRIFGSLTVRLKSLFKDNVVIEKDLAPELLLKPKNNEAGQNGRIRFEDNISSQGVQVRYNHFDSERNPYGLKIEESSENPNTNGAYLEITGTYYGDGSGLTGTASLRATGTTKSDVGLGNIPNLSVTDSATGNTIMQRNSSGDTWARLFRSSYSGTNSDIAAIYTTRNIGGDYMRPSTPAQVKSALNITAGDVGAVPTGRNIATGTGLSGGGNLTANRVFSLREIYAGSSSQGALWYHGTTKVAARLYGGGSNPSSSNRLNYDGYLWATRFYTPSSIRYKNIDYTETLQTSLDKVVSIGSKGVKVGHYKESETKETIRWFIAEEVNEVTPEAVTKDDQGRPDGIDSDQLIPDLYAAIAELTNRVKELEEN